ncbi:sugar phosphate nucleotidyltransferase [Chloroflexota bacterium]
MPKSKVPLKAIILVGGEGTRLYPLTYNIPKPMLPILNRPFLEHTIAYLKKYGVDKIILTLSYLPKAIQDYFGDGSEFGVQLTYTLESRPLGTAGAVKNAEQYLDDTFAVLNGDIFTNLNITDMLNFHQNRRAKVTIALTWVDNPCAFGVVETDSDGKVKAFIEKPNPKGVTTNWINAGIYILEPEILGYVSADSHYMFEKGLFPLLIQLGEPVYGYHFSGNWLDVGTPDKYLCLNRDLLLSKEKSALIDNLSKDEVYCDRDAIIHPSAKITGPVIIASRCRIDQRVHIKGPVVIGPDCYIGNDASLEEAVLWRGVNVGAGAFLKQCVVGNDTNIRNKDRIINRVVPPRLY